MPTIAQVFGVSIRMYLRDKEHNPPHIHAISQDSCAVFLISTGEMLEGDFPKKKRDKIKEFILLHKTELEEMWETGNYKNLTK